MALKSTDTKNIYEKGYHVTEACMLTKSNHPVSIFSEIHSSKEKSFTSTNDATFSAMEQDYVIRLTTKRKIFPMGNGFLQRSFGISEKTKLKRL